MALGLPAQRGSPIGAPLAYEQLVRTTRALPALPSDDPRHSHYTQVRLEPKYLKFSPVAEPSSKLAGKFFLQLAANGSVHVTTSELHTELSGV